MIANRMMLLDVGMMPLEDAMILLEDGMIPFERGCYRRVTTEYYSLIMPATSECMCVCRQALVQGDPRKHLHGAAKSFWRSYTSEPWVWPLVYSPLPH